ncbi:hypothetical protein MKW92_013688 [Papaver armeniacum]|nr:hypothetical protein MKW92_013688 [Papaver armeniacum]
MGSLNMTTKKFCTHLHLLFFLLITLCTASNGCHEEERRALLNFKSSLEDPSGRLFTWQESIQHQNCCSWQGIQCSKGSFHVISIDLRNNELEIYNNDYIYLQPQPNTALQGKLSPSLLNITHLEYLDLGFNDFQESKIALQFSYLVKLAHLDLSHSNFSGSISTQLTNSSSLQYLDLYCGSQRDPYSTSCLESSSTKWIRGLTNLRVLRLSGMKLSHTEPLLSTLYNLTLLSILDLSSCSLNGSIPYLPQLKELDVSNNKDLRPDLTGMFENSWPKLQNLQISSTNSTGSIPSSISNLSQLVSFSASWCSLRGSLPTSIYNLSRLQHLDVSGNNITSFVHSSISNLKDLHFLDLSFNKFQGHIPESICDIFPLTHLGLQYNNISGTIPSCITKLKNLSVFDVFGNSIRGEVSLISLITELNLTTLDLSSNNLTVVIDKNLNIHPSKANLENYCWGHAISMDQSLLSFVISLI